MVVQGTDDRVLVGGVTAVWFALEFKGKGARRRRGETKPDYYKVRNEGREKRRWPVG